MCRICLVFTASFTQQIGTFSYLTMYNVQTSSGIVCIERERERERAARERDEDASSSFLFFIRI